MRRTLVALTTLALGTAAVSTAAPAGAATHLRFDSPTVVALWHLDESSGASTMVDSSGYGNDGAISDDVQLGLAGSDSASDTAYGFYGPQSIVRVPSDSSLNPGSQPLTISASLNVPLSLPVGDYNVLQKGQADAAGGAYKMEINGNAGSARFGFPDCEFHSGGVLNRVYGPEAINDGAWHDVTCHLTDNQVWATVDGVSGTVKDRTVASIANSVDLTLGGKPNLTHFFFGSADEVSITIG